MHPKGWLVEVHVVHPHHEEAAHVLAFVHVWYHVVFVFYTLEISLH
jgi:hypothetical protein